MTGIFYDTEQVKEFEMSMPHVDRNFSPELTREYMIGELQKRVCTVEFNKVNGDYRKMACTLIEKVLPPAKKDDPLSQKKVRAVNPEVVVAWDTMKGAYRSFRVDSVISFT